MYRTMGDLLIGVIFGLGVFVLFMLIGTAFIMVTGL